MDKYATQFTAAVTSSFLVEAVDLYYIDLYILYKFNLIIKVFQIISSYNHASEMLMTLLIKKNLPLSNQWPETIYIKFVASAVSDKAQPKSVYSSISRKLPYNYQCTEYNWCKSQENICKHFFSRTFYLNDKDIILDFVSTNILRTICKRCHCIVYFLSGTAYVTVHVTGIYFVLW